MRDADQSLTGQRSVIRTDGVVPSSDRRTFITPREVERRYPRLSRRLLTRNRSLGLPPRHEVVSGCIMYDTSEIERFLDSPAAMRCAIYGRADSLFDPSSTIVREVEACDDHLLRSGWTRVHTCVEFGPPSRHRTIRRGLQELLNEAFSGEFDVLLVHDLSHIATNSVDQRRFIRQFKTASVQVVEAAAHAEAASPSNLRPSKPRGGKFNAHAIGP